mmetsp:Transcript_96053/g.213881  ORF Transcript_96053/g.213881 Transcript_96053/m.213881 type:complete len:282 (-) Transcript_96053:694-1539(-)
MRALRLLLRYLLATGGRAANGAICSIWEAIHRVVPILLCLELLDMLCVGLVSGERLRSNSLCLCHYRFLVVLLLQSSPPFQFLLRIIRFPLLPLLLLVVDPFLTVDLPAIPVAVHRGGAPPGLLVRGCINGRTACRSDLRRLLLQVPSADETRAETRAHLHGLLCGAGSTATGRPPRGRDVRIGIMALAPLRRPGRREVCIFLPFYRCTATPRWGEIGVGVMTLPCRSRGMLRSGALTPWRGEVGVGIVALPRPTRQRRGASLRRRTVLHLPSLRRTSPRW